MEEDRHLVALRFGLQCLATVPILRMVGTSSDCLRLTAAMISANRHPISGWVAALVTPRLTLGAAALGRACGDIGERHRQDNSTLEGGGLTRTGFCAVMKRVWESFKKGNGAICSPGPSLSGYVPASCNRALFISAANSRS